MRSFFHLANGLIVKDDGTHGTSAVQPGPANTKKKPQVFEMTRKKRRWEDMNFHSEPLNLLCMLCDYDLLSGLSTGWQVVLCLEPHSRFGDIWPFARLDGTGVGLDWDGFGALIDVN